MKLLSTSVAVIAVLTFAHPLQAQTRSVQPSPTLVRGFADFAFAAFTARESFETILGSANGTVFGGGAEVVIRRRLSVSARFGHFSKDGQRVFVTGNEVFPLGIPVTVTVRPLMFGADYRFPTRRVVPYVGGAAGVYGYKETSSVAEPNENVSSWFAAYEIRGGIHAQLMRWVGAGTEIRWTTVPGALGGGGVSKEFGESNLGGVNLAVRLTVGR